MQRKIVKMMKKVANDEDILAVMLFGSYVRDEGFSDIDVCMMMQPKDFSGPFFVGEENRVSRRLSKLRYPDFSATPHLHRSPI
jgi:predicted nucleotidyltransferase